MKTQNTASTKELKEILDILKKGNKILKKEIENLQEHNKIFNSQINIFKSYNKILKEYNSDLLSEMEKKQSNHELFNEEDLKNRFANDNLNLTEV
ncbi:MAG: hypothetical protein HGGPFJEG_00574 [Ignavibacteria bacterium]|nr:hypothetical protein [Ignavibacteria bacterium]